MKKRINSEFSFDVWISNEIDSMADEIGSFDDNWSVSAGDLFDGMEMPTDMPPGSYEEAA